MRIVSHSTVFRFYCKMKNRLNCQAKKKKKIIQTNKMLNKGEKKCTQFCLDQPNRFILETNCLNVRHSRQNDLIKAT